MTSVWIVFYTHGIDGNGPWPRTVKKVFPGTATGHALAEKYVSEQRDYPGHPAWEIKQFDIESE